MQDMSAGDHNYVELQIDFGEDNEESDAPMASPRIELDNQGNELAPQNTDHDYVVRGDNDTADVGQAGQHHDQLQIEAPIEAIIDAEPVVMEGVERVHNSPELEVAPNEEPAGTSNEGAANAEDIINLTTPSPAKKRKRLSRKCTPKANTPKLKSQSNGCDAEDDEDEGLVCPICLDTWEMSGEHRLVSLRCGHLFGEACIRRWLNECARQSGVRVCPQCKTKAANKDIRCLYAKRLRAIDRSEEHQLREQLDNERLQSQLLQSELNAFKMSFKAATAKISTLEADNERMKHILRTGGAGFSFNADDPKLNLKFQTYKLYMERNIDIAREPGCRVMIYAERESSMIVSQKSAQNLFPGYGLRFIDTPTFRPLNFLHASAKILRDVSLSADQSLLSVVSMEPRAKLFDLRTKQVTSVFTPSDKALWACAMDRNERENFIYLGAQHGSTYLYDIRFPETVVNEFKTEGDLSPVINVAAVPTGKDFPSGGFLVCKLQSLWFYEYSSASGSVTYTRLCVEGPFISMNYDVAQGTLLVSARNNARYPQSRFMLGTLEKIDDSAVYNIKVSFFGSKATPVMTRCTQIAVEANTLIAGYLQDSKLLALFDARRELRLQSMPVQEVVYDNCPIYTPQQTFLAALTETKCRIYKLTPLPLS